MMIPLTRDRSSIVACCINTPCEHIVYHTCVQPVGGLPLNDWRASRPRRLSTISTHMYSRRRLECSIEESNPPNLLLPTSEYQSDRCPTRSLTRLAATLPIERPHPA